MPLAPQNFQPLPFHHVFWMDAMLSFLSDNASTTSPAIPVSESTFQVPIWNPPAFSVHQPLGHNYLCILTGFPHLLFAYSRHVKLQCYLKIKWPIVLNKNVTHIITDLDFNAVFQICIHAIKCGSATVIAYIALLVAFANTELSRFQSYVCWMTDC